MKKSSSKTVAILLALLIMVSVPAVAVCAEAVYYKGTLLNWDHGRKWGGWSYSEVFSHVYEHSATANSTFSGWIEIGKLAEATQWIGLTDATAYWDARG